MFDRQINAEVRDLGGGKFSVRLSVESPEGTVSQTQTVSADGRDTAVELAKEAFTRWLDKVTEYVVKNMPARMKN